MGSVHQNNTGIYISTLGDDVALRDLTKAGDDRLQSGGTSSSVTREQLPDVTQILMEVDVFVVTVDAVRSRRYSALCDHAMEQT